MVTNNILLVKTQAMVHSSLIMHMFSLLFMLGYFLTLLLGYDARTQNSYIKIDEGQAWSITAYVFILLAFLLENYSMLKINYQISYFGQLAALVSFLFSIVLFLNLNSDILNGYSNSLNNYN